MHGNFTMPNNSRLLIAKTFGKRRLLFIVFKLFNNTEYIEFTFIKQITSVFLIMFTRPSTTFRFIEIQNKFKQRTLTVCYSK